MAKAGGEVTTLNHEFTSPVPPARLFKALCLDPQNLLPKIVPQSIKSIDVVSGNGGPGTVKQTNFAEGSRFKYMKHKIDSLDENNNEIKYTVFEGDMLGKNIESICYEIKFEPSGSGCVCKTTTHYKVAKDGAELKEEEIKAGKERASEMYKVVENHLVANPTVYA
ncbi:major strawberry allergen Fra a 1-3-like [Cornus florida]|uniref:major strawberry allergen Fra a 1-3-like n=1 Tax=Cornus florida TaxID=4283 RepID=UPI002896649D|nr:major strawberry allergen Fra a 1-3-like [Cornus florida]